MIQHYLKIAYRNILKHKTQSIISIVGLAIGLACFALSTFWIQYEMTYDNFHRDVNRMYLVRTDESHFGGHYNNFVPYALGSYLKTTYSEIEDCCAFEEQQFFTTKNKQLAEYSLLAPDSAFMRMMDIKILAGNNNFLSASSKEKEVAITESMARELFGTTEAVGKSVTSQRMTEHRICAIVSDWGRHSNFRYSMLGPASSDDTSWNNNRYRMLVKVKPRTDINALLEKMNQHFPKEMKENRYGETGHTRFYLEPVTGLRYADEFVRGDQQVVQFRYIVYFSLTGLLIILCALINYLTIYVDCFRARKREMALRKVNGASERSLLALLSMDFLFTILFASLLGMVFIELLKPLFLHYSMIVDADVSIYGNCLLYVAGMSVLSFIVALFSVYLFRRRSLQNTLHNVQAGRVGRICRKGSIVLQLVVCILFIFCTAVMQMQLYHLRNVDTGMEYCNRGSLSIWMNVDMNVWAEKVKALPMVTEVVRPVYWPMISMGAYSIFEATSWDGLSGKAEKPISIDQFLAGEEFFKFYEMKLLAGEWISEKSTANEVNILETTARAMGWTPEEAIGKHISYDAEAPSLTVVGVLKDCAYKSPTSDLPHAVFVNTNREKWAWGRCFVLFKYLPGTWDECRRLIEEMQQSELPDRKLFLDSEEERYNKYLQSEDALSGLFSFSSLVCILISIFGIYSLVTLSCELRRKEIAVRKVNGATLSNILGIFFKEYTLLLAVSSLIAFPIGYLIMKHWIETYNRQVNIGVLPFILIFVGIAIIITLSIGWRVWKAARQNPAEVIKSE